MQGSEPVAVDGDINDVALTAQDSALLAKLLPRLHIADQVRVEKYAQYCWRRKVATALFALLAPLTGWIDYMLIFVWSSRDDDKIAGLTLMMAGALYRWMTAPKRAYAKTYKQSVLPEVAALYGLQYKIDGAIDDEDLRHGGIAPSYDRHHSEDYFEGTYKGARMRFAEIKLTERRGSGKNRRTVTVFKGLAVIIELPKVRFYGHTIVIKHTGKMNEWVREKSSSLRRADLVDPHFEGKYSVFTNDQVEARYLLDPAMIERINKLEHPQVRMRDAMSVAYRDGCVYMLLPAQGDLFEPADITIPATDPHALAALRRQIADLLGVIDQLEFYQPPQK